MTKITKASLHASIDDLFELNRDAADALGTILNTLTASDTAVTVKSTRRGRKPKIDEIDELDDLENLDEPVKSTRRGRKPKVEDEPVKSTRRSRKPKVEEIEEEEDDDLADLENNDDYSDDDVEEMEITSLESLSDEAIQEFLEQFEEVTISETFENAGIRELTAYFKEVGLSPDGFEGKRSERAEAMAAIATTAELVINEICQFELNDIVDAINELLGEDEEEYVAPTRGRENVKIQQAAKELFRLAVEQQG